MKNQVNILNISGAVASASLMVFLYFLPSLNAVSLTKRRGIFKTPKIQIRQKLSSVRNKKLAHSNLADNHIFPNLNQEKKTPKQIPSLEIQKINQEKKTPKQSPSLEIQNMNQEGQSIKLAEKCKEPSTKLAEKYEEPSESNGCPKNLDYYTKRPRPKQMPEECFTCRNLITCVCLTDK